MRVYLPFTLAGLAELVTAGRVLGPLPACAVTSALREWYIEGDAEDLEYAAMSRAADLSLAMLTGEPRPRRIVVAADADAELSAEVDGTVGVLVPAGLAFGDVAAVHADGDDAVSLVRAARQALERIDAAGGVPREVEDLDAHELEWFDPSEASGLLAQWA